MIFRTVFGADPKTNPRLATVIASAKKAGFPKASIESSIARGQGTSASGAALESMVIEAMLPPSIAIIVDLQTDNKARSLADLRMRLRSHKANPTPTSHMFHKAGRIVLEKGDGRMTPDEVLYEAVDAGAEDVELDEGGRIVVSDDRSKCGAS